MSKVCRKCGELKPLTGFDKNCGRNNGDGHLETCTPCRKERTRKMTILNFKHLGMHLTLKTRQEITEKMSIPSDVAKALVKDKISVSDLEDKLGIEDINKMQSTSLTMQVSKPEDAVFDSTIPYDVIDELKTAIALGKQNMDISLISIYPILMTVELAHVLRPKNKHNRAKVTNFIDVWSTVMKKGEWFLNGDTITMDRDGNMLDGQHRIEGVIKSGVPVPMILITGIDPAAYSSKDCGKPRVVKDTFQQDGKGHDLKRAATTNVLDAILEKDLSLIQRNPGWAANYVYSLYKQYEPIFDEIPFKNKYKVNDRLVNSVYVYLLINKPQDKPEIHRYFNELFTGLIAGNKQPYLMREWLDKHRGETNNNSRNKVVMRLLIKSVLKFLANAKDKSLQNNKTMTFKYLH